MGCTRAGAHTLFTMHEFLQQNTKSQSTYIGKTKINKQYKFQNRMSFFPYKWGYMNLGSPPLKSQEKPLYPKALSLEQSEVVKTFFGTYAFVEHENLILLYKEQ